MSRVHLAALFVLLLVGRPGLGQDPPRPAPLPDHWLTLDSLAQALALTADQRAKVAEPYTALNAVMKEAATRRAALRSQFRRGSAPGEMTPAEREAMRARRDSVRAEFEAFQTEADQWYQTIRNLLTPEQHAKFDALPKPQVAPQMPFRRAPGG